jgi:hypothetical protein
MSSTRTGQNLDSQPLPEVGARTNSRDKSAGTRLSVEEMEEVESAAKRSGKSLAEWFRDTVLREARQRPDGPFCRERGYWVFLTKTAKSQFWFPAGDLAFNLPVLQLHFSNPMRPSD